ARTRARASGDPFIASAAPRLLCRSDPRNDGLLFVPFGEAFEPAFGGTVAQPFFEMLKAELAVETARRVPVEHMKIDPGPAALHGDRRKPRHQPPPDAMTARRLAHEKVFEVEGRRAEPGRKPRVEQRHASRFAVELGYDRFERRR